MLYESMSGLVVVMMGGANVIMQLARLPIGRGVAESVVERGSLTHHPLKRTRTTLGYIAIALLGSDEERAAYRREIDRVHQLVRSRPGSDVTYNAFDPQLQLWVAACIYVGANQILQLYYPKMAKDLGEEFLQHASRLGTTLQVTEEMWPPDRQAFEEYWTAGVEQIEMDDLTRRYLYEFSSLRFLPAPLAWGLGPAHRFITAGFLPSPFRDQLGLPWTPRRQRIHDRIIHFTTLVNRRLPSVIRRFPFNLYLWDARRRIRTARPIL